MNDISKEYGQALFELANEKGIVSEYFENLQSIRQIFSVNGDYREMLSSPIMSISEKRSAIDQVFSADFPEYIVSFLKLLTENGRIKGIFECIDEFEHLKMLKENTVRANIFSAVPLTEKQKDALCEKLEKSLNKKIDAVFCVNEKLLGGLKIEVDGKTIDGSIENHLNTVKGVISV